VEQRSYKIETHLLQLISPEQAYDYQIVPIEKNSSSITFKTSTINVSALKQELQIVLGKEVLLISETEQNLQQYLKKNYRKNKVAVSESLHYSEDFLLKIILEAKNIGSSDIHFETFEHQSRVRFRIDGKLLEKYIVPLNEYPIIVNRIKIMAGMDISEKRLPQDGRITIDTDASEFDIRVSALPTLFGEKIVLRLLSKDATSIHLDGLGFTKEEIKTYRESIKNPNGIILISGPTGSGKTTTLYATLKELNNPDVKIITIEDPIEFVHQHRNCIVTQREVGVDTENYEVALKNTLRQAPDVILIGEVRDRETMEYAIAFAETGHLCLTTLHANSTNQALDRIINFFPEDRRDQLLMDLSLNLKAVVSQRLVPLKGGDGRVPAVEVMLNTPLMSDLVFKGKVHEIKELMAKSNEYGMKTFDQALFDLYEEGYVTYEDALRNADSINDLRLRIKLQGKAAKKQDLMSEIDGIKMESDENDNDHRLR